ncbi:hypothetical protein NEMBOFW57_006036 [Staphylotrichum longicolle]|uniref:Uncharacterized protein n=1 Tax=Staphylotrichum longicolle TaxID=669026 RepID=A0AAD4EY05_9PEZI|nr:hypothetical protein NEMBOFW57_006036 [Staphylotrichum longicolle]
MEQQQSPEPENIIQPDERWDNASFDDEAAEVASSGTSLTSITSSVLRGKVEDGRVYAVYGKEEYGMPMDDVELDRIGIWSIDVADMFPSANVLGVDIAPTQPDWVPPNCIFELDDIEQDWAWKENSFDLIFARDLILAVRDWPRLIDQAYRHLKPGGWVEFHCVTGIIQCDDNTLPDDSPMRKFSDALAESTRIFGTPIDDPLRWKGWFQDRGLEDVSEEIFKMPCNPWPKDQRLKLIGAFEMENLLYGLSGMVTRLFVKALKWTPEQVQVFLVDVRKEIKNRNVHCYWPYRCRNHRSKRRVTGSMNGVGMI